MHGLTLPISGIFYPCLVFFRSLIPLCVCERARVSQPAYQSVGQSRSHFGLVCELTHVVSIHVVSVFAINIKLNVVNMKILAMEKKNCHLVFFYC